jgi:hypothetical protein
MLIGLTSGGTDVAAGVTLVGAAKGAYDEVADVSVIQFTQVV